MLTFDSFCVCLTVFNAGHKAVLEYSKLKKKCTYVHFTCIHQSKRFILTCILAPKVLCKICKTVLQHTIFVLNVLTAQNC